MTELLDIEVRGFHAVSSYAQALMKDRNVTAVSVGRKIVANVSTDEPCVTIYVARKISPELLTSWDLLPRSLDPGGGNPIVTDVVEAGPFYEEANTTRIRPAQPGTSIGATTITAGTFGAVVVDQFTAEELILSNNHILAANNAYPIGGPIVQPGPYDHGTAPADTIATLLRFVTKVGGVGTNIVDCAVARPIEAGMIANTPLDDVPAPSPGHRAVALHIGGGPGVKWGAPMTPVLSLLHVRFPVAGSVVAAFHGQSIQKTGRTTQRTAGKVVAVGATVVISGYTYAGLIGYPQTMTAPGDSGAMIVEG